MNFKVGDEIEIVNLDEANVTRESVVGQKAKVIGVNKETERVKIEGKKVRGGGDKGTPFGYVYESSIRLVNNLKDDSEVV